MNLMKSVENIMKKNLVTEENKTDEDVKPQIWVVKVTALCEYNNRTIQYEIPYKFHTESKARVVYEFLRENKLQGYILEKIDFYEQKNNFVSVEEALKKNVQESVTRDNEELEILKENVENFIEKLEEEPEEENLI
jgi:hypothetical protein